MLASVAEQLNYSLSGDDIRELLGRDTSILLYPQLQGLQRVPFDKRNRCVVLYLTKNSHTGHWTLLLQHSPQNIEWFDSFGLAPDGDARWLTPQQRAHLGEAQPLIHQVLRRMKAANPDLEVFYNSHDFQSKAPGVDDCGRHVATRAAYSNLSLDEYADMIRRSGMSADEFVVAFTAARLGR